MGRITIRTVAEACGVSPSTVSNAYNRPGQLSAALRERILATAEQLGYPGPSAAGRSLRSGRAGAIGVLLADRLSYAFSDPYAIGFLVGVSQACERAGVSVLLLSAEAPGGEPDLAAVQRANIDGLVSLSSTLHPGVLEHTRRRGLTVVSSYAGSGDRHVAIDDVRAGRLVGEHLAGLGHRRVAWVVHVPEGTSAPALDYRDRLEGLRAAMPGVEVVELRVGHNSFDAGRRVSERLLRAVPRATAAVAGSDVLALGLLHGLAERGVAVPAEVSVAGFDDVDEAVLAGLTTVAQPIVDKGRRAAELLLEDPDGRDSLLLDVALVDRASTGVSPPVHPAPTATS